MYGQLGFMAGSNNKTRLIGAKIVSLEILTTELDLLLPDGIYFLITLTKTFSLYCLIFFSE